MENRCPHLPQTTVSIELVAEAASAVPRIRLATLGDFTNAAPGAAVGRDRYPVPLRRLRNYVVPEVSLHLR